MKTVCKVKEPNSAPARAESIFFASKTEAESDSGVHGAGSLGILPFYKWKILWLHIYYPKKYHKNLTLLKNANPHKQQRPLEPVFDFHLEKSVKKSPRVNNRPSVVRVWRYRCSRTGSVEYFEKQNALGTDCCGSNEIIRKYERNIEPVLFFRKSSNSNFGIFRKKRKSNN